MRQKIFRLLVVGSLFVLTAGMASGQSGSNSLKRAFRNPPSSAYPRVWWHWMNGNISKEGIKLDIEWMHRVGISGFQTFDAALETPQVVDKRVIYMTPEWKDAFRYAIEQGDRFGMEMAIAGSPGWSESGGPWVPPSQAMKKYVWSETVIEGGKPFAGKLVHPPVNIGSFQNMGVPELLEASGKKLPAFYADSVVVAFRLPPSTAKTSAQPKVTINGNSFDTGLLNDGDFKKTAKVPVPSRTGTSWIQFEYPSSHTVYGVTYVPDDPDFLDELVGVATPNRQFEASDDGVTFRHVADLNGGDSAVRTVSFPPATAKFFRMTFKRSPIPPLPWWADGTNPNSFGTLHAPPTDYEIAELILLSEPRINHFEEKAGFVPKGDLYEFPTPSFDYALKINKSDVIELTSKMDSDGTLHWTPPTGSWMVLRFGYSLRGTHNHPATPEATGLEVDKLDRRYVKNYFEQYLASYRETVGAGEMGKKGIQYVVNDSWEAGAQNWTDKMLEQFKRLRGYDATSWLPALTGRIVESSEASDRFLWDFRKTIADLVASEHYGQLEETLHVHGMGHYGESHEAERELIADGMEVKKFNEVPMSAMWMQKPGVNKVMYGFNADDRESASVAHIYGQNIAAAESLTAAAAPWGWWPATLKPTADQELLNGINRFVIHESAHQPLLNKAPGLTLGPFGQWFNRNETWAEHARPWLTYLARTSYMLQQGHYDADVVYFYGEDSNLTAIFDKTSPDIPDGYGFDYINADALIHELSAEHGRIVTKSGMKYKVLGLHPSSRHMSLGVLNAIYKLVESGAIVVGDKPTDDPSLSDDQAVFERLSAQLFGDGTGIHKLGKGTVYAGQSLTAVFGALAIKPDFDYAKNGSEPNVQFVHRKLTDGDIYFVDNRSDSAAAVEANFRVAGKVAEMWTPETGATDFVSYKMVNGRTNVPLKFGPWEAFFVVFRRPTSKKSFEAPHAKTTTVMIIHGPWDLTFEKDRGAPPSFRLNELADWSKNLDSGVKYFSGIGTYTKTITAAPDWFRNGAKLWLDLGEVKNLAEISVNGKEVGQTWHSPYRIEISTALKPGVNCLTIKVVNAWVNRLIGDEQSGATRVTFADVKPYAASSPLLPSGLLGPITLIRESRR